MSTEAPTAADSTTGLSAHQRVTQLFDRAKQCLERGDYAYAHDLFSQCVAQSPGSLAIVQHFRANLAQISPDAPAKPSNWSLGGARGAVAKAAGKGEWAKAFETGCAALKKHPGDTGVLCEMAEACGKLGHTESQLYFLRWALDLAPHDNGINRQAAYALEKVSQFDQAIGCWARVLQQKPNDEEARKAISRLSVEKTIDQGGYDPALLRGAQGEPPPLPRVADLAKREEVEEDAPAPLPDETLDETEQRLRDAIDAEPKEAAPYVALADFYTKHERLQDAERLYRKALKIAGEVDLDVLEKLEDVYLRRMQGRAVAAERRIEKLGESGAKLARQARAEANQAELEVYAARRDRKPTDPKINFELGLRYRRVGRHREAIVPLQAALDDKQRVAETHLHLGESFQQINQHRLALRSYESAIAACDPSEWTDLRKLALYRAGVLAMGMKEVELAEKHLTDLAAADFGYRDVGERLDKLARVRKDT